MVSAASKGEAMAGAAKVVTPREDPVKRLERLLEETRVKQAAAAKAQLSNAREALTRADANVAKWERIQAEAKAKVAELEVKAGITPVDETSVELSIED